VNSHLRATRGAEEMSRHATDEHMELSCSAEPHFQISTCLKEQAARDLGKVRRERDPVNVLKEAQHARQSLFELLDNYTETAGESGEIDKHSTPHTENWFGITFSDENTGTMGEIELGENREILDEDRSNVETSIILGTAFSHEGYGNGEYHSPMEDHGLDTSLFNVGRRAEVIRGFHKLSSWENLLSALLVTGSVRFSVEQFELFRACVNTILSTFGGGNERIPTYSTVARTLVPFLRNWSHVKSEGITSLIDSSKSGARVARGNSSVPEQKFESCVDIRPSWWSMMDVACMQT